jgi:hypothetical protein
MVRAKPTTSTPDWPVWTRENTYLIASPLNPWPPRLASMEDSTDGFCEATFTPLLNSALKAEMESSWGWIDRIELTPDEITAMTNDGIECPVCAQGKGWLSYQGRITGVVLQKRLEHGCQIHARIGRAWRKLVPPKFRAARLDTLVPFRDSRLSMAIQAHHIQFLREHRMCSLLLAGETGTGKTHFAYALYFEALAQSLAAGDGWSKHVFFVDTASLLEEIHQYKFSEGDDLGKGNDPPLVTPSKLKWLVERGARIVLFLDEIDKVVPTETRLNTLLGLVTAVSNGRGQIVATSNMLLEDLEEHWKGCAAAGPILERICGKLENGRDLEFLTAPQKT